VTIVDKTSIFQWKVTETSTKQELTKLTSYCHAVNNINYITINF